MKTLAINIIFLSCLFVPLITVAQNSATNKIAALPKDLEMQLALSALPPT